MGITFLKKGKEAHKAMREAEKAAEARAAAKGAFRFWVKQDGEGLVTFLDGNLTSDGLLDTVSFNQHNLKINGKWRNYFVCVADNEPCPLCEMDNYPTLVALFTVLDHTKYTDRNGKVHQHERKLFVAKRDTMKRLQKLAAKRGGLTGWTVSISRTGERSPEVGTDFDFEEHHEDLVEFGKTLKLKAEDVKPLDYEKEIKYLSADELRELGFGTPVVGKSETSAVLGKKASKKVKPADDDDDPPFDTDDDDDDDGFDKDL